MPGTTHILHNIPGSWWGQDFFHQTFDANGKIGLTRGEISSDTETLIKQGETAVLYGQAGAEPVNLEMVGTGYIDLDLRKFPEGAHIMWSDPVIDGALSGADASKPADISMTGKVTDKEGNLLAEIHPRWHYRSGTDLAKHLSDPNHNFLLSHGLATVDDEGKPVLASFERPEVLLNTATIATLLDPKTGGRAQEAPGINGFRALRESIEQNPDNKKEPTFGETLMGWLGLSETAAPVPPQPAKEEEKKEEKVASRSGTTPEKPETKPAPKQDEPKQEKAPEAHDDKVAKTGAKHETAPKTDKPKASAPTADEPAPQTAIHQPHHDRYPYNKQHQDRIQGELVATLKALGEWDNLNDRTKHLLTDGRVGPVTSDFVDRYVLNKNQALAQAFDHGKHPDALLVAEYSSLAKSIRDNAQPAAGQGHMAQQSTAPQSQPTAPAKPAVAHVAGDVSSPEAQQLINGRVAEAITPEMVAQLRSMNSLKGIQLGTDENGQPLYGKGATVENGMVKMSASEFDAYQKAQGVGEKVAGNAPQATAPVAANDAGTAKAPEPVVTTTDGDVVSSNTMKKLMNDPNLNATREMASKPVDMANKEVASVANNSGQERAVGGIAALTQ